MTVAESEATFISEQTEPSYPQEGSPPRRCPAPADFLAEVASYDRGAEVGIWKGPRYRMTYRSLGEGPPLLLVPGIASTYRGYSLTLRDDDRTLVKSAADVRPGDLVETRLASGRIVSRVEETR